MKSYTIRKCRTQKGGALIIMALILLLAGTTALFSVLDASGVKVRRDNETTMALAEAKAALIGFSIKAVNTGTRPGNLIIPDFLAENPVNYDGRADSGCLNVSVSDGLPLINSDIKMRCLGRLPWKDLGMSIRSPTELDVDGSMPWYAVSANLVDATCLTFLNTNTLNLVNNPPPAALDCSGTTLPYPWLTVRDSNGNVVSNRVAAVIFYPGAVRGSQSRSSITLATVDQYLDTLVVPVGCSAPCVPGSYSNADMDNDFIMASASIPSALTSNFNDQLVYITIDELLATVEKRVAGEIRSQLVSYKNINGIFPDTASVGYQGQSCVKNSSSGFLPLPICHCSSSICDCVFPATIRFTSDKNYKSASGSCSYSSKTCTCNGEGSCLRASNSSPRSFVCSRAGTCVSNVTGTFSYKPFFPIDGSSMSTNGACTLVGATATCTGTGDVQVDGSLNQCLLPNLDIGNFPPWFSENGWKHLTYYTKGSLTVGATSASSLVVMTGSVLGTQSRPSNNISDYLDSAENTDGNTVFDATGTARSTSYNDQMFIVAP